MKQRMKRCAALFTMLALLLCAPAANAANTNGGAARAISSLRFDADGTVAVATVLTDTRCVLAAALYEPDGRLLETKTTAVSASPSAQDVRLAFSSQKPGSYTLRAFLLDRSGSAPLCSAAVCPAVISERGFSVKTLVEPRFEAAQPFSDGYAAVKLNGKWGYIDETGRMAVPARYDWASHFSEGVAVAGVAGRQDDRDVCYLYLAYPDGSQTQLQMPRYNYETDQYEMTAAFVLAETADGSMEKWCCSDGVVNAGNLPYRTDGSYIAVGDTGALDSGFDGFYMSGACVDGVIPMLAGLSWYWDDYCREYGSHAPRQAFYMNKDGEVLRAFPGYRSANDQGGILWLSAPDLESDLIIVCDCYGKIFNNLIPDYFIGIGAMKVDIELEARDDESGENNYFYSVYDYCVIPPEHVDYRYDPTQGRYFSEGVWALQNTEGKWGAVDPEGRTVIPFAYDFLSSFSEGMAAAILDGRGCFVDLQNNRYEIAGLAGRRPEITAAGRFRNGIAAVYDAAAEKAYCVRSAPDANGVLPVVSGTEQLSLYSYFPDYDGTIHTIITVDDIIVIEEDGKFGYARLTFR